MSLKITEVERIVVNVPFTPRCEEWNAREVWQWRISEVIRVVTDAGLVGLTLIAVLGSLISVYYYLRLPVVMYMREPGTARVRPAAATLELVVLAVCAVAVVALGIFPSDAPWWLLDARALDWARASAALLF